MEQNAPVIAKRIWGIVRVVYFMLRKGISKRNSKLLLDLNMVMKRGKIASKAAINNLMTFHAASVSFRRSSASHDSYLSGFSGGAPGDYEFSCSNTPNNHHGLFHHLSSSTKPRRHGHAHNFFGCAHAPPTLDDDVVTANALKAVMEILNNDQFVSSAASPALPGFGRSPAVVRQLRITDSPFPLRDEPDDESRKVDEAAEEFIKRFYKDLSLQRKMAE